MRLWIWSIFSKQSSVTLSKILLNIFSIDVDHVSIAISFHRPALVGRIFSCESDKPSHQCLQSQLCTTWKSDSVALPFSQNPPCRRHHSRGRPQQLCGAGRRCPDGMEQKRSDFRRVSLSNQKKKKNHSKAIIFFKSFQTETIVKFLVCKAKVFLSSYLWGVCFDWWAALCSTVQGKVDERFSIRKGHLVDNVGYNIQHYVSHQKDFMKWSGEYRLTLLAVVGLFWKKAWEAVRHLSCSLSGLHSQCPAVCTPLLQWGSSHS